MSDKQQSNYPFYQFCIGTSQQCFVKCFGSIFTAILIIIMMTILYFQVKRRYKTGTKKLSKKCIILYLMIINFLILLIDSLIITNKYITELEPFFRTMVFIYVFYYISQKYSTLSTNRRRSKKLFKNITISLYIIVFLGFIFVFIELMMQKNDFYECQFKYGNLSRITCGIVMILLIIYSDRLQNKMDERIQPLYKDQPMNQMKQFHQNETQREDLRILILMYYASQFLTLFSIIYQIVKQNINQDIIFENCNPCQLIPCVPLSLNNTYALEFLIKLSFQLIIIGTPYIALMTFFWVDNIDKNKIERPRTISNEEDIWNNFFKNISRDKQKLTISDTSEIPSEKSKSPSLDR